MLVHIDETEYRLRAINIATIQNHNQALCDVEVQLKCIVLSLRPAATSDATLIPTECTVPFFDVQVTAHRDKFLQ
jgi:hypothetical protein